MAMELLPDCYPGERLSQLQDPECLYLLPLGLHCRSLLHYPCRRKIIIRRSLRKRPEDCKRKQGIQTYILLFAKQNRLGKSSYNLY